MADTGHSGLHYEANDDEALQRLRRQAQSLNRNLGVDIDRVNTFATASPGATDMSGLVTEGDPEALADEMRAMRAREADLKVQHLLDRAERAAERGDHRTARRLADEAMGLDRTSLSAWLLKASSLIALHEFAEAVQVIAVAAAQAKDLRGRRLAATLKDECERAELRAFSADLVELLEKGRLEEAARRVEARLRERPDHPTLLHTQAVVLVLSGKLGAARTAAEKGLRVAGRSETARFEELLRSIAQRECEPRLEAARVALRGGDTTTALARLDECAGAIGDSEHFQAIWSYAHERHAGRASLAFTRRRRLRHADAAPIEPATLQWLIEWLVRDELKAGWKAMQNNDFAAAQKPFEQAAGVDDRCHLVAFLLATSIFRALLDRFEAKRKPTLDEVHDSLVRAERLAAQAKDDDQVGRAAADLAATVRSSLDTLRAVQAQVARSEAVNRCVGQFNALVQHYERYPIRTYEQKSNAQRSFDTLAREAERLRSEGSTEPREVDVLRQLTDAIRQIQRQLRGY